MRRARPLLGTLVDIQATGIDAMVAIEAAFSVIAEVHRLMSFHEPDSDVSRINRCDGSMPVSVSPRTYEVLQFAYQLSALTDGAFDVTVARKLVDAGFLPPPTDASNVVQNASYRDVELLPSSHIGLKKNVWIDLGGIAKGYAVDCAIATLREYKMDSALINAGGDLRFFGLAQPIHIRHPNVPGSFVSLGLLENCAIATSSSAFSNKVENESVFDPLVDTKKNMCISWNQSVSVIAPDCMTADALTKVVRLFPQGAQQILAHFEAEAVTIDPQGKVKQYGSNSEKRVCA